MLELWSGGNAGAVEWWEQIDVCRHMNEEDSLLESPMMGI